MNEHDIETSLARVIRMVKQEPRLLPLDRWPEADRHAWQLACQPTARLRRGGAAGKLRPSTRKNYAEQYARFLGFLNRCELLQSNGEPAANVMPDKIEAYLPDLKYVASTTAHRSMGALRRVAQIIAPDRNFDWLSEIEKDFAEAACPRSKFDRTVLTEILVESGLILMREAELSRVMTEMDRACVFRNGLMVALLALCPIRRKNFTGLEIGRSFVKIGDRWWIVLAATDTKEKRADERPVDELLTPFIESYLSPHRAVLARSDDAPSALWLSAKDGTPITASHVTDVISATTLSTVGVAVSPHLFRTAAASSAAIHGGANPYLGAALLHHADPSLTAEHYNRASSLTAAESFRQIVRQYDSQCSNAKPS
jgi:site-specific recombinase XerD